MLNVHWCMAHLDILNMIHWISYIYWIYFDVFIIVKYWIDYSRSHLGWHFRMMFQKLKAQSSNVSFHWNVAKQTFELWALSFRKWHPKWDWLYIWISCTDWMYIDVMNILKSYTYWLYIHELNILIVWILYIEYLVYIEYTLMYWISWYSMYIDVLIILKPWI